MDDLISRQAAIDAIVTWTVEDRPDIETPTDLVGRINALPSAQPTQSNTPNALTALDCISRQAALDECLELAEARRNWGTEEGQAEIRGIDAVICALHDLPSAQPERKRGKWIKTISENGITSAVRCSECGFEDNRYMLFRYCPNCGAQMER